MEQLTQRLCKWVGSTYIPMLTMLENYVYESELQVLLTPPDQLAKSGYRGIPKSWIEENTDALRAVGSGLAQPSDVSVTDPGNDLSNHVYLSLLYQCSRESGRWKGGLSKLERSLVELWADRIALVYSSPDTVKDSLVFAKYLVASPAMVRCVLQAVALRHMSEHPTLGKSRSVKTALVIGGPGSGKDSMALLIQLFSPGYRLNRPRTLNMAMFRPKEAAVPFLLGLDLHRYGSGTAAQGSLLSIDGLLHRAIEFDAQSRSSAIGEEVHRRGFTFILDELNSLDIDTQGVLSARVRDLS
jgi:hypothetical protein